MTQYTLTNKNGLVMKVIDYGAIVTEFHVPDRDGKLADIVLGFENLEGYLKGNPYFGATVGRVANRIMNAKFNLVRLYVRYRDGYRTQGPFRRHHPADFR